LFGEKTFSIVAFRYLVSDTRYLTKTGIKDDYFPLMAAGKKWSQNYFHFSDREKA